MSEQPRLLSIQVGRVRGYGHEGAEDPMDRPWRTAFFKTTVDGPVALEEERVTGDEQGDTENHGGPDKAVLAYSADHHAWWSREFSLESVPGGAFGENFTIAGLDESAVCIGDAYMIGDAVVQVSQPRAPCWKFERRWRRRGLMAQIERRGCTGWYLRVLAPGTVGADLPLELLERPFPALSVARANELAYQRPDDLAGTREFLDCEFLAAAWQRLFAARLRSRGGDDA